GLGGWMLQEGYMLQTSDFASAQYQIRSRITELIGKENTEEFYSRWLANHMRRADVDSLNSWGFNLVRLPMHYNLFTLPIEDEPIEGEHTWLDKGFALTDSLIAWCKDNEMYVMLDLHAAPGGQGRDQAISDYDPTKPSLWESKANRDKTVALWKQLAERYANEPWVAGYDLLNEPNWEMNGNIPLRDLYLEITDSIRTVDQNHIIFIEGNWFANDFTGLTPPWDNNMVYSPHKYWSVNDKPSIQWVLDIRDTYNIPLFFGESGENSNVWFRDAIRLFEDEDIGWAWWPLKKIESISGPLSIAKTEGYTTLLEYWKGNGIKPTEEFASQTLFDLTELLRVENCTYQKDVIDAMFRQVYSEKTKAYKTNAIPGVVYATDYDLGQIGYAYFDTEAANYNVSTGTYTSWNNGWALRNDGVDIEVCEDLVNSNGYNVGWIDAGEWMQYDIEVARSALYDVSLRIASATGGGRFKFKVGNADITTSHQVPSTGAWTNWTNVVVPDVMLDTSDSKFRIYIDEGGFNLSSLEFIETGSSQNIATRITNSKTHNSSTIQVDLNKPLTTPLPANCSFIIHIDGSDIQADEYIIDSENPRIIYVSSSESLRFDQSIKISYEQGDIQSTDGVFLDYFEMEPVLNTLEIIYPIPGKIEAEDFIYQEGVQLESSEDNGGGLNIGFLDSGDFLEYQVEVKEGGDYILQYRVASERSTGSCRLTLIDEEENEIEIDRSNFPSTGAWQDWTNLEKEVSLTEGVYTMRLSILSGPFNLNWMNFIPIEPPEIEFPIGLSVRPNPFVDQVTVTAGFSVPHKISWDVHDILGQRVKSNEIGFSKGLEFTVSLRDQPQGHYFLNIYLEDETRYQYKLVKF
ncbi:MAG: carbohydrate-binding protein, partial [Saprospiraceae bacterium]|nr:carbohydrate-binding protein [Saprospiraceae bacterium]